MSTMKQNPFRKIAENELTSRFGHLDCGRPLLTSSCRTVSPRNDLSMPTALVATVYLRAPQWEPTRCVVGLPILASKSLRGRSPRGGRANRHFCDDGDVITERRFVYRLAAKQSRGLAQGVIVRVSRVLFSVSTTLRRSPVHQKSFTYFT